MSSPVSDDAWRDVLAIREVLERYAGGVDRRDWTAVATCFAADCFADYGRSDQWHGRAEIVGALDVMHREIGPTMHRLSNHSIDVTGDVATAVTYLDAYLKVEHRGFDLCHVVATYHDEFARGSGGWEIASRRLEVFMRRWEMTRS
jgi:ketosteroid isomerase-like protein